MVVRRFAIFLSILALLAIPPSVGAHYDDWHSYSPPQVHWYHSDPWWHHHHPVETKTHEQEEKERAEKLQHEREAKEKLEKQQREKEAKEAQETKERQEREAKEHEQQEQPKEVPTFGSEIAPSPTGPPSPSSGWSVAYGDSFVTPIHGTPQASGTVGDNTWQPEESNHGCCNNSNEPTAQRVANVQVGPGGLEETCTYSSVGVAGDEVRSGKTQHYLCGGLSGAYCCAVGAGVQNNYKTPWFELGKGQTLAFQIVAKLPVNTDEADPGWWADGPPWGSTEVDFPEFYGSTSFYKPGSDWENAPWYYAAFGEPHPGLTQWQHSFVPDQGFHTYTFEILPANPGYFKYRVYVDGSLQSLEDERIGCYSQSCASTESVEVKATTPEDLNLILDYSLRENSKSEFTLGSRTFYVRSAAVYVDTQHVGVGIGNSGLAPGTSLELP